MFKRAFTASFDHPGARYHAEGLRYPTFLASKGFFPFSSLSYICVSIKYLWKQSFESLFSGKVKRCFYFLFTRQSCSKKLKNWSRGKWTVTFIINAILPYLTHNIVAPALPSCQCHRQMPLHNQRCRDQSSYGLASTIQHFILSSLPLFTQFHSVYNSEILCCQCHLSNTVSLHHCLFIPDPFSCSKFFNTATWCLPYCRSESNSAMFILHPPASLFPPLPALIMGNSLICWFHWTLQDQPLTALRPS